MKRVALSIVLACLLGVPLLWPLGWLFDAMKWPIFNSFALDHGMAPGAWVLVSGFSYVGLRLALGRRKTGEGPRASPNPIVTDVTPASGGRECLAFGELIAGHDATANSALAREDHH